MKLRHVKSSQYGRDYGGPGAGSARAVAWGCDLTFDYIKINADYAVRNQQARRFWVMLAIEKAKFWWRLYLTLKFSGKTIVIKYGGTP